MKIILGVLLVALIIGIVSSPVWLPYTPLLYLSLPPGYTMCCAPDGYKTFKDSKGHINEYFATKNRYKVINDAWWDYNLFNRNIPQPPSNGPWEDCE